MLSHSTLLYSESSHEYFFLMELDMYFVTTSYFSLKEISVFPVINWCKVNIYFDG